MTPLTWFGHWQTWAMLAGVWLAAGVVFALTVGVMARVEEWRERRGGKRP